MGTLISMRAFTGKFLMSALAAEQTSVSDKGAIFFKATMTGSLYEATDYTPVYTEPKAAWPAIFASDSDLRERFKTLSTGAHATAGAGANDGDNRFGAARLGQRGRAGDGRAGSVMVPSFGTTQALATRRLTLPP